MLKKEDMNKYNTSMMGVPSQRTEGEFSQSAGATVGTVGGMILKSIKTVIFVLAITGLLVFISVASFILSFRDTEPPDLNAMKLSLSSTVYLEDDTGAATEYMTIHGNENRVWVALADIPLYMQTAQIAIEDHRFYEHHGVDWKGTFGAVYKLFSNTGGGGGSTLTQQLIKNITDENQVSILRKVKEIFTALNMEKEFTKDEILEAYLNKVNYGGQCHGVEAAANFYFDKTIGECSLAECAVIAGITQNPWQYYPMVFPENTKERATIVLERIRELSNTGELSDKLLQISDSEIDMALSELESMTFLGVQQEEAEQEQEQNTELWNWYIDTMFEDIVSDLMEQYSYSYKEAVSLMYNGGLEIHSAMDQTLQSDIENLFLTNKDMLPDDEAIELGFFMMDPYTGKVLAVVGSRAERVGVRLQNNATMSERQSGSSIKPLSVYALGIKNDVISYGSVLKDQPIPNYFGPGSTQQGPQNFSMQYEEHMNVDRAIEQSQNAPAAWLCQELTTEACYDWLVNSLHFTTLVDADAHSLSSLALGGQTYGVTVREMTAGFQMFANGGFYYEPFTYYYVKDANGSVILDNRDNTGEQVLSLDDATVMNKLLQRPIYGSWGTATGIMSQMNTQIFGKTGTTDSENDLWFVGGTPFCVAGIWNGYKYPSRLADSNTAKVTWRAVINHVMENYDWSGKQWVLSPDAYEGTFCRDSGKIAGPNCFDTATGWYIAGDAPATCNGGSDHVTGDVSPSPSTSPSPSPSASPSAEPSASPSIEPSEAPPESSSPESSSVESQPVTSEPSMAPEPPPPPTSDPTPTPTPPPPPPVTSDVVTDVPGANEGTTPVG